MADVDFSNAVLDVNGNTKPMTNASYLGMASGGGVLTDGSNIINANYSLNIIQDTPTKVSLLHTGTFTASGNTCYTDYQKWKISNISFSPGDTYSFIIDIETSGN